MDIYKNNLSAQSVIRNAVARSNPPLKHDSKGRFKKTHGYHVGGKTNPIFRRWSSMMYRCYGKHFWGKKWYKESNIKVAQRWHNPETFIKDMSGSYFDGASLERINNSKGYSKRNCKWITLSEQSKNRRTSYWIEYKGKRMILDDWAKQTGINRSTLKSRLTTLNWSIEKSLITKPRC